MGSQCYLPPDRGENPAFTPSRSSAEVVTMSNDELFGLKFNVLLHSTWVSGIMNFSD